MMSPVVLDVFVQPSELSDLEGGEADEGEEHQQERVDAALNGNRHLERREGHAVNSRYAIRASSIHL